jgi:hypothetical protein
MSQGDLGGESRGLGLIVRPPSPPSPQVKVQMDEISGRVGRLSILVFWLGSLKSPLLLVTDALDECEDERYARSKIMCDPDLRSNPKECG